MQHYHASVSFWCKLDATGARTNCTVQLLWTATYAYIRTQHLEIFRPAWRTDTLAAGIRAIFMTKYQLVLADCLSRMMRHRRAVLAGQVSADDPAHHNYCTLMLAL